MIYYIYLDCNKFNKRQLFDFIKTNNIQPIRITKVDHDYNTKRVAKNNSEQVLEERSEYKILVNKVSKSDKDKLKTIYILGCMKLKYA